MLSAVFSLFAVLVLYISFCFTERYRRLIAEEEEHEEETPILPDLSVSLPIRRRKTFKEGLAENPSVRKQPSLGRPICETDSNRAPSQQKSTSSKEKNPHCFANRY